ncbi:hypothetical protein CAPTEDRAFT_196775 [Capitella teleta]|uniref:Uncharacterized protein n=1 Tax=Capitella teleta TaxID=283909 RepID=R7V8W9_CAPTE|nr:hypothetical protein CAPTEDRAFT_196775 [Capitella teleta]|eukprot:ELU15019.1 hypothetical protein CAPTEDRAFT_196775 [Capitella teleta]
MANSKKEISMRRTKSQITAFHTPCLSSNLPPEHTGTYFCAPQPGNPPQIPLQFDEWSLSAGDDIVLFGSLDHYSTRLVTTAELADGHDGDCLLREEDTQLRITRTALYTAIHRIIRRKTGERMHLTEAEVEESLLRPLYQFAFEAHRKNETVVREKDSKKVENFQHICQVGYLTNEVNISRLQEEVRFQFTHKTFLEFLTAKHIAEMDSEERLNWMQHLRYANCYIRIGGLAIEDDFKVEQNEPILGFLFGLLEEESAELTQMASLVMKETRFSYEHPLSYSCEASHQLLRLLAELSVVPPELADPPIRLNVDLGNSRDEEEKMSFVQELIESKNIECSQIWIHPRNDTHLWNIVSGLRIGQADSVQQISLKWKTYKVWRFS